MGVKQVMRRSHRILITIANSLDPPDTHCNCEYQSLSLTGYWLEIQYLLHSGCLCTLLVCSPRKTLGKRKTEFRKNVWLLSQEKAIYYKSMRSVHSVHTHGYVLPFIHIASSFQQTVMQSISMKLPICHMACNLSAVKWWSFFEGGEPFEGEGGRVSNEAWPPPPSALRCIPHALDIENRSCQCWKFHSKRTPPPLSFSL